MDNTANLTSRTVPIIPVCMFVVGVVGNVIAIAALSRSTQECKVSAFYTLVCGLAVTDLLGTCLASPITIATYLYEHLLEDTHLCKFHSFLLLFFGVAGLSITCAMSTERYIAICHPYTYQRWSVDQCFARRSLFSIYIANVAFCCLPVMGVSEIYQPSHTWCFINWRTQKPFLASYSFLYAGVNTLLILVIIVCNFAICGTLLVMRQRIRHKPITRSSIRARVTALSSGVETQMILLLTITSVVVLVCSAPLVVRVFINQITLVENSSADLTAIRIASVNPILDPWIYILFRRTLFRKFLALSKRICRRQKPMSPDRAQRTVRLQLETIQGASIHPRYG